LYGYEILSLTLREENRLRVFEKRVLRRIFGIRKQEIAGGWRRQHNEDMSRQACSLHRGDEKRY
jgi:hypothetical protein